jgi:hypothetical protein
MDDEREIPSQADEQWWASENTDWHDLATDEDDEDFDHQADVSEALSMMERGIWPY